MVAAVNVYLKLPVNVRQENGHFIASCFLLDKPAEGPSKQEALDALAKAVHAFMTACYSGRRIDTLLHEYNLHVINAGEDVTSGRYIDVSIMLKAPE